MFPKLRGTFLNLGVPIIRIIVSWGLCRVPLFWETTIYIYICTHWGNVRVKIGMMEEEMETTIQGLGCRDGVLGEL